MGDWSMRGNGQQYFGSGQDTTTTEGVAVTSANDGSPIANAELLTATPFDAQGILIHFHNATVGGSVSNGGHFLVNIEIGPALTESVLIPNLLIACPGQVSGGEAWTGATFYFPISVKAGTRISANLSTITDGSTAATVYMSVTILSNDMLPSTPSQIVDSMGIDFITNEGTPINVLATNTKFNYVEVMDVTDNDYSEIVVVMIKDSVPSESLPTLEENWVIDIATGSVGNEVVVIPGLLFNADLTTARVTPPVLGPLPFHLPKGSRISARAQCSAAPSNITIALYGISPGV